MKNDLSWVDYAKGIGIILVVYGHVARGLFNANLSFPKMEYELIDSIVYSFHMPLFFFLSGLFFCSSLERRGSSGLILNKIDTIFYPYIVWSILQGSIEVFLSNFTNGKTSLSEVFNLLVAPRAQFWYLYILFIIFIMLTIIFSISRRSGKIFILFLFFAGTLFYLTPEDPSDPLIYNLLCKNLVYFSFGMMASKGDILVKFLDFTPLFLIAFFFIFAQWFFHGYLSLRFSNRGIESLLLALISIIFVTSLSVHLSKNTFSFLAYLGSSSLAIYLMHILVGSSARIILLKVFNIYSASLHLLVGFLLAIILPCFISSIFKRIGFTYAFSAPISTFLKRIYFSFYKKHHT
jgi:fucose 4-O-acetylase-like acetyltransferase